MIGIPELRERLGTLPRERLGFFPTPLHDAPRLSTELGRGVRVLMKREDQAGLAFGGNKTRVLEFTTGQARAEGADCVVAAAYAHSNHCRQAAAAAARLGLEAWVVLRAGIHSDAWQGNLLLDELLGAHVELVEARDIPAVRVAAEALVERLRAQGRRPFLLTLRPEVRVLGTCAALETYLELVEQLEALDVDSGGVTVFVSSAAASVTGMTLGARATGHIGRVVGVSPDGEREPQTAYVEGLLRTVAERLGLTDLPDEPAVEIDDTFLPPGYGQTNQHAAEAIRLVARTEGVMLDPVYTGKGMAGLVAHVRSGRVPARSTVVFIHTGGQPNLFSYAPDLGLPALPDPMPAAVFSSPSSS
jgi:1-aminocyclopropane-1-carboxylate deaminase/D-cysteine desulfhydrase-like pyridoxal-dependent ACC family enzyme